MRGFAVIVIAISLAGCGAVDAVGAAARVVATGVELTGSVVGATADVVGSAAGGAVDLATGGGDAPSGRQDEKAPTARPNAPGEPAGDPLPQTAAEPAAGAR